MSFFWLEGVVYYMQWLVTQMLTRTFGRWICYFNINTFCWSSYWKEMFIIVFCNLIWLRYDSIWISYSYFLLYFLYIQVICIMQICGFILELILSTLIYHEKLLNTNTQARKSHTHTLPVWIDNTHIHKQRQGKTCTIHHLPLCWWIWNDISIYLFWFWTAPSLHTGGLSFYRLRCKKWGKIKR